MSRLLGQGAMAGSSLLRNGARNIGSLPWPTGRPRLIDRILSRGSRMGMIGGSFFFMAATITDMASWPYGTYMYFLCAFCYLFGSVADTVEYESIFAVLIPLRKFKMKW
jgi:hypothetical protein|uniref:Uncharacterized protein n=1 Tax=viral metagenome TaxID=1070528 RepID=A0A6C0BJP9_9ZZZZ